MPWITTFAMIAKAEKKIKVWRDFFSEWIQGYRTILNYMLS